MLRVVIRIPSTRSRPFASAAAAVVPARRRAADPREAGISLAEKFNLAKLNGGKNPFDVSSNRLLKHGARSVDAKPVSKQAARTVSSSSEATKPRVKKSARDLRDVYSLEYLTGRADRSVNAAAKNPFDVASAKLM